MSGNDVEPPVVVEFTYKEAARLAKSLLEDFDWEDTTEEKIYDDLYNTLVAGLEGGG